MSKSLDPSMFASVCREPGCANTAGALTMRCTFHSVIADARTLSPRAFDQVRKALEDAQPLTDKERRERAVRSALSSVEWYARDLKRAKRRARQAGATEDEIAVVVRKGKADAR